MLEIIIVELLHTIRFQRLHFRILSLNISVYNLRVVNKLNFTYIIKPRELKIIPKFYYIAQLLLPKDLYVLMT